MRAIVLVVMDVLVHQPFQMPFIQHDHMVEQIVTATADPALGDAVLPRTAEADPLGLDAKALHCVDDFLIEARAAIKNQVARGRVIGKASRSCWTTQALFGCFVTWQWRIRRRSCAMIKKQYSVPNASVGTVKKSIAAMASR